MTHRLSTGARRLAWIAVVLLLPAAAGADACNDGSPYAFLSFQTATPGCFVVVTQEIQLVQIFVRTVPAQKIRFSLPDPPFGTILTAGWNYSHTGDLATGIELTPPSCIDGEAILLGTLFVQVPGASIDQCTLWTFQNAEIVTCDGNTRRASGTTQVFGDPADACDQCYSSPDCPCFTVDCLTLPSYEVNPPNGAAGVDPAVEFSWTRPSWEDLMLSSVLCIVRISSTPECLTGQGFAITEGDKTSFSPDFLMPNTTYYWQVQWVNLLDPFCSSNPYAGATAWNSFTTGEPLAVEHQTWGHVKSLYR